MKPNPVLALAFIVLPVWATITGYSPADSCWLSKSNPECKMASGKRVYEGAVACPMNLKLGKCKALIYGKWYTCEDRYNSRLDKKRGMPTFDVFSFTKPRAKSKTNVIVVCS